MFECITPQKEETHTATISRAREFLNDSSTHIRRKRSSRPITGRTTLGGHAFLSTTVVRLLSGTGSIYCPLPASVSFKQIKPTTFYHKIRSTESLFGLNFSGSQPFCSIR